MPLVLVTGGIRSGKSEAAEALAYERGEPVTYVATGEASDPEMAERIARHRARRDRSWVTVETADLSRAISAAGGRTVIVDSLGAWIARRMTELGLFKDAGVAAPSQEAATARAALLGEVHDLAQRSANRASLVIVVSEESGLGPVPADAATRCYLDIAGEANQLLASFARQVLVVISGQAVDVTNTRRQPRDERPPHGDSMVPPGCINFAVNVEQSRPSWLSRALEQALAKTCDYPAERAAVEAICEKHGRKPEEVVPTNGATEAIWLLTQAVCPRHAVCVHPSFTEPDAALAALGLDADCALRGPENFGLVPEAVSAGADFVVTTNPNNPSGHLDSAELLSSLATSARVLVVDEAFMDFVPEESESLAERADIEGLVVVRSLTKAFGLAGIRAGYLLAPRPIADAVRRLRPAWNVNTLALRAIAECCSRPQATRAVADRVARDRELLQARLESIDGVCLWPSWANFVLCHIAGGSDVAAKLREHGIAVRPAGDFPGLTSEYLRIAVRPEPDTDRLARALQEVLR